MNREACPFCYTAYYRDAGNGRKTVRVPGTVTHEQLLRGNVIGCLTAIYDSQVLGKVPMPEAVTAFFQAFIEAHHTDEEFRKRRRDRPDPNEQKFGKSPIFTHITRQ